MLNPTQEMHGYPRILKNLKFDQVVHIFVSLCIRTSFLSGQRVLLMYASEFWIEKKMTVMYFKQLSVLRDGNDQKLQTSRAACGVENGQHTLQRKLLQRIVAGNNRR
jgi:hypothetical protein